MEAIFTPFFVKQFRKLEESLQDEASLKVELFKDKLNHEQLKVHKLRGKFKNCYSFSVNYKYRIVFMYQSKSVAILLAVGDHDVYQ